MTSKIDQKKDFLLRIAQKNFARFGLKKTTMDEIAKIANMGKAGLYYYFKNKETLFAEVISKEADLLKHVLRESVDAYKSPKDKLTSYIFARMLQLKKMVNYYNALTDKYLAHYSFIEKERENFIRFEIETLKNIFKQGNEQKIFQIKDIQSTARMVIIALKGLEYPFLIEDKEINIKAEIDLMLDVIFNGIETR